jgi:acyl-CoA thioesterase-2
VRTPRFRTEGTSEAPLSGQASVDALVQLLNLSQVDDLRFTGQNPPLGPMRIYGGQVAAQALVAAGRTVSPDRLVHSLHGYFVRSGNPAEPIEYHVERIRDGRSFSVRRSVAQQGGKTIFFMSASFHIKEQSLDHHDPAPEDLPGPEEVPTLADLISHYPERIGIWKLMPRPFDVRYLNAPGWLRPGDRTAGPHMRVWMKTDGTLPDDPLLHACLLTYASDMTLLDSVLAVHGEVWGPGGVIGASLDHAIWFHRPFRADEWFLYDCSSPTASGSRGLAMGRMFSRDGRHIASAVQEGLLRRVGG